MKINQKQLKKLIMEELETQLSEDQSHNYLLTLVQELRKEVSVLEKRVRTLEAESGTY